jgi:acetyltransferase-like isoleucine patch superfamily enzyme
MIILRNAARTKPFTEKGRCEKTNERMFLSMEWNDLQEMKLPEEEFARMTRYANGSDNAEDNARRAELLGFGGREVLVAPGAILRIPREQVGRHVFIGLYSYLNGNVTVEDNVLIGPHCSLAAGNHKFDPATGCFSDRTEGDCDESIVVGAGSWLASNITVTGGVKIGRANLICAGAVVTHSTADYAIIAGIPARQVGRIDPVTGEYLWNSAAPKKEEKA